MIRFVDLTFYTNHEYADTTALLQAQRASLFYIESVKNKMEVHVVKHVSAGTKIIDKENFKFFVSHNKPGYIAPETIRYLKKIEPDVVIVHGLGFTLQVIRLKMILGKKVKILAWHHAERPVGWPKKLLYILADLCISKYFFTSHENAGEWIEKNMINNKKKIAEIPPTLTVFQRLGKKESKAKLKMGEGIHYLWVGRLDPVKDPLTPICAFEKFIERMPSATLHMIYQSGTLLSLIEKKIQQNPVLKNNIILHGHVPNETLAAWYSAVDFFISASISEAGSVTILEAMACGCIPLVTAIPASLKVIENGRYGFQYPVGDVDGLVELLIKSTTINHEMLSTEIQSHFQKKFSVEAVAEKLVAVCNLIVAE